MLLQSLLDYASRIESELPPAMYQMTPVRWVIRLDRDGANPSFILRSGEARRSKDRGLPMLAPHVTRAYGIRPKLLADTGEYALGVARTDGEKASGSERVAEQHAQFKDLVKKCAEVTGEPSVAAVASFLDRWNPVNPGVPLGDGLEGQDVVTFEVDDVRPIDLPSVRRFWAEWTDEATDSPVMTCVACGERKAVKKRMPVLIKGIPGGQTSGMALISANSSAYESYGLEASLIAPTCRDCGERVATSINRLIQEPQSHLYVGKIVYLFWTRDFTPEEFPLVAFMQKPEPAEVRALIRSPKTSKDYSALQAESFYAVALSASGGRVVVRDWIKTTLGEVKSNLKRWFEMQHLVGPRGEQPQPLSIFDLARSLYRETNDIPAEVPTLLFRSALTDTKLPDWLIFQAVRRNRAEQGVTYPRAALIKMILAQEGGTMAESLETLDIDRNHDPAYVCGRLLAIIDSIQRQSIRAKSTLIDRYFGTASTAPASVFGHLLRNTQHHLAKLRKNPSSEAAYRALDARLADAMKLIRTFPTTLDLKEQALFSLGFYHQRAYDQAQATARKAAKEAKENG